MDRLSKEGEVEIFKRIEDGMREMCARLGRFLPAVELLLELYEKHKRGEIKEEMVVCVNEEVLKPANESQGTLSNFDEDRISKCDIEKHEVASRPRIQRLKNAIRYRRE